MVGRKKQTPKTVTPSKTRRELRSIAMVVGRNESEADVPEAAVSEQSILVQEVVDEVGHVASDSSCLTSSQSSEAPMAGASEVPPGVADFRAPAALSGPSHARETVSGKEGTGPSQSESVDPSLIASQAAGFMFSEKAQL